MTGDNRTPIVQWLDEIEARGVGGELDDIGGEDFAGGAVGADGS